MTKQQTKKEKLDDLFCRARVNLPGLLFTSWLEFCYGIFEHAVGANRKVNRYDITLIAKELEDQRKSLDDKFEVLMNAVKGL